jgi:hypothetical protein
MLSHSPQFIQLLGTKGAGKTSHLLHWQQQTGGDYYYQKPWDWRSIPPFQSDQWSIKVTYWDEANRIPTPTLIWALKGAYHHRLTVVVASHINLAPIARFSGYPIHTIRLNCLTLPHLQRWISQQFQAEFLPGRSPGQELALKHIQHQLTEAFLTEIIKQSQGSWRRTATLLHRWLAQQIRSINTLP